DVHPGTHRVPSELEDADVGQGLQRERAERRSRVGGVDLPPQNEEPRHGGKRSFGGKAPELYGAVGPLKLGSLTEAERLTKTGGLQADLVQPLPEGPDAARAFKP